MKAFAFVLISLITTVAFSQSFTLTDNLSGQYYVCSPVGNNGNNGNTLGQCVSNVTEVCKPTTSNIGWCFNTASSKCKEQVNNPGFANCVVDVTKACIPTTSNSGWCFSEALDTCKN